MKYFSLFSTQTIKGFNTVIIWIKIMRRYWDFITQKLYKTGSKTVDAVCSEKIVNNHKVSIRKKLL